MTIPFDDGRDWAAEREKDARKEGYEEGYWKAIEECAYVPRLDGKGTVPACMACGERLRVREQGRKKK